MFLLAFKSYRIYEMPPGAINPFHGEPPAMSLVLFLVCCSFVLVVMITRKREPVSKCTLAVCAHQFIGSSHHDDDFCCLTCKPLSVRINHPLGMILEQTTKSKNGFTSLHVILIFWALRWIHSSHWKREDRLGLCVTCHPLACLLALV